MKTVSNDKLDDFSDFEDDSEEVFQEIESIENQVRKFHDLVLSKIKGKRKNALRFPVAKIQDYFNYEILVNKKPHKKKSKYVTNWLPVRFRTECVRQGVHMFKARGRTYAEVSIDVDVVYTVKPYKNENRKGMEYEMPPSNFHPPVNLKPGESLPEPEVEEVEETFEDFDDEEEDLDDEDLEDLLAE